MRCFGRRVDLAAVGNRPKGCLRSAALGCSGRHDVVSNGHRLFAGVRSFSYEAQGCSVRDDGVQTESSHQRHSDRSRRRSGGICYSRDSRIQAPKTRSTHPAFLQNNMPQITQHLRQIVRKPRRFSTINSTMIIRQGQRQHRSRLKITAIPYR